MDSSYQPSRSGGGGALTLIIVLLLLVALGVGGYFGYKKWWLPKQCVAQKATSNVATWVWDSDSGTCMANTCVANYGCDANGTPCTTGDVCAAFVAVRNYKLTSNSVCSGTASTPADTSTDQPSCQTACDKITCSGYDWNSSVATGKCTLIPTGATAGTVDTSKPDSCYIYTPPSK